MAAGDRTKLIRDRAIVFAGLLPKMAADRPAFEKLVFQTIDSYQKRIAEEVLCLEGKTDLSINSSGEATEPSGFYRLKFIERPSSLRINFAPEEVDPVEFDYIKRVITGSGGLSQYYFKRWNGTLTFHPNPGAVTWTIHYYKVPTTNVSSTVDPEIPTMFDKALEYAVISELMPFAEKFEAAQYYRGLFEMELNRVRTSFRRTKTVGLSIYPDVYE